MKTNSVLLNIIFILVPFLFYPGRYSYAGPVKGKTEKILVKIGNKSISVDEFYSRAEYTIRPSYCKGNTSINKRMVLNSLIAEKLMAMEVSDTNEFISNLKVTAFLKGRKEQAMRLLLYNDEISEKAVPDTCMVSTAFEQAGRKYKIKYVSVNDSVVARQIAGEIAGGNVPFENILTENYSIGKIPEREVLFNDLESEPVINAFYCRPVYKDQVLGPIMTDSGYTVFAKVIDWADKPAITGQAASERMRSVKDRLKGFEAKKGYEKYIRSLMRGKSIVFNPDTFLKLADLFGPLFIRTEKDEKEVMKNGYFAKNEIQERIGALKPALEKMLDKQLLEVDGKKWTVSTLINEMNLHPLVFRKNKIKNKEFGEQLQLAIIDLVRDIYITEKAYSQCYDTTEFVKREFAMWKDNMNFLYARSGYLKENGADSMFVKNPVEVLEKYLNPHVRDLQKKYASVIEFNINELEKLKLTKIDMAATYSGMPYAQIVPSFPIVTTGFHLDYGKKMDTKNK